MPRYSIDGGSNPWAEGFSALAQAMFPDPTSKLDAIYKRAQAEKAGVEAQLKAQEYGRVQGLSDLLAQHGPGVLSDPALQQEALGYAAGDPEALQSLGMVGAFDPEMDPTAQGRRLYGLGMQNWQDTYEGQMGADLKVNQDQMAFVSPERQAALGLAGGQVQGLLSPLSVSENETVYPDQRLADDYGVLPGMPVTGQMSVGENEQVTTAWGEEMRGADYGPATPGGGASEAPFGSADPNDPSWFYQGSGVDAQNMNANMQLLVETGRAANLKEARQLVAYADQYGTDYQTRTTPDGGIIKIPLTPASPFSGTALPGSVAAPAAPAGPQALPARGDMGAPAPAAPEPPQEPQGGLAAGEYAPGVEQVYTPPEQPEAPTVQEQKNRIYFTRLMRGHQQLNEVGSDIPNVVDAILARPKNTEGMTMLSNMFASDEAKKWSAGAQAVLTAALRLDTGAAAPLSEYGAYLVQFVPMPGDGEATLGMKATNREILAEAIRSGLDPEWSTSQGFAAGDRILDIIQERGGTLFAPTEQDEQFLQRFDMATGQLNAVGDMVRRGGSRPPEPSQEEVFMMDRGQLRELLKAYADSGTEMPQELYDNIIRQRNRLSNQGVQ